MDVRTMIPLPNETPDPARYSIGATTVLRLERRTSGAGVEVLGFYHSHPTGAARPSRVDLELACPGYLYVIIEPDAGTVRAWRLAADARAFAELPLEPVAAS